MNAATLKALKGSIAKWKGIVAGRVRDMGIENCPLCKLFYFNPHCKGCPVAARAKDSECLGTPYVTWVASGGGRDTATTPALKAAATAELTFLRSLLPRKKPAK